MSWLVWSACFDYLWLYSFFAPVPLPHFIFLSLTVPSCLTPFTFRPHTHFFRQNLLPVCMHACLCDCWCVCVCVCVFFTWTFFIITVAPYCLFLSRLWAAAHPLAAARFKKSITADQEAEVCAFRPGAQELTVGREWDFYAYCNPGGFPEPSTGRTTASHVKFTGLSRFFLRWQYVCRWTQRGACKMCVWDISPPSTFQYCHVADDQGSEWITKREREGMFEVFHIDLIRQHNRTLKPHVSLLEYVTSILCFSLNIPSRGGA